MKVKVIASGSRGNCYLIDDGKSSLLLDAGIPYLKIAEGTDYKVSETSGCLISHIHQDHSKAVKDLLKRGVRVYGPAEVKEHWGWVTAMDPWQTIGLGTFNVTAFLVPHDAECYGYKIESLNTGEKLVYITDAGSIPEGIDLEDIDYWMVEANYSIGNLAQNYYEGGIDYERVTRIQKYHMDIGVLIRYLGSINTSRIREIWLIHLSNDNSDAETFKKLVQEVTGAPVYIA